MSQDLLARDRAPRLQDQQHLPLEVLGRAQAVDAGDRGHDDDVAPRQEGARRRQAQAVDVVVDRGVLLDVGVGLRDVGLGLVVVVVGDEVADGVLREEALELAVELRGERLVVRDDERRPVDPGDDVGHGEGLAGAGHAEQHLAAGPRRRAPDQLLDRLRLVAVGLVRRPTSLNDAAGSPRVRSPRGRPGAALGPRRLSPPWLTTGSGQPYVRVSRSPAATARGELDRRRGLLLGRNGSTHDVPVAVRVLQPPITVNGFLRLVVAHRHL